MNNRPKAGKFSLPAFLAPLIALLFICAVSVGLLVTTSTQRVNDEIVNASLRLASNAVEMMQRDLGLFVRDNSYWYEAIDHLVLSLDQDWIDEQFGEYFFDSFAINTVLVIDGRDRLRYIEMDGQSVSDWTVEDFSSGLLDMVAAARAQADPFPEPVVGLLRVRGVMHLIAMAALNTDDPVEYREKALRFGDFSVLAYGKRIDASFLEEMEQAFLLENLQYCSEKPNELRSVLALQEFDGTPAGALIWNPAKPGDKMFQQILPAIGISLAALLLLSLLMMRRIQRVVQALEHSQASLSALNRDLEQRVDERTRELKEVQQELVRNEKFAAIGQLTATVSHELRNPMATLRNAMYVLQRLVRSDEPMVRSSLELADRSVVRCDHIVTDLLDFSRLRELVLEPTRFDEWLQNTLSDFEWPPTIRLQRDFGAGMPLAFDRDRLYRAISNVVMNACQAMEQDSGDGCLTVRTRVREERLEITFEDTGPGIPPDIREHIFEPLFSTKSFGVGLGLPIVRQVMEQHQGGVEIDSELGQGTRVILWLPLNLADVEMASA